MVKCDFNPSTQKAEAGVLHKETLNPKIKA